MTRPEIRGHRNDNVEEHSLTKGGKSITEVKEMNLYKIVTLPQDVTSTFQRFFFRNVQLIF